MHIRRLSLAACALLVLLSVGCGGSGSSGDEAAGEPATAEQVPTPPDEAKPTPPAENPDKPKPVVEEAGTEPAPTCEEALPACEKQGISKEECCDGPRAKACSGRTVNVTITSSGMDSWTSEEDCHAKYDEVVQAYCRPRNLGCGGTCATGSCQQTGEATDTRTTKAGPPQWECVATTGRCFCDCL